MVPAGPLGAPNEPPTYDWVEQRAGSDATVEAHAAVRDAARTVPVTDRSVDPADYGEFMRAIFDEWIRNDVGDISVRLFDQRLGVVLSGRATLCVFEETCGAAVPTLSGP